MSEKIGMIAPFGLRMRAELREKVQAEADRQRRSLNWIICEVLEQAFSSSKSEKAA